MSLNNLTTYNPLTINGLDGLNINGSPFDPTNYVSKIDPNIQTISGSLDAGLNKIKSGASPSDPDDLTNKLYVDTQNNAQDLVIATKASTTYVDTQNNAQDLVIATKASTTYVDTQNNAQDLVIATKASTTYVDTQNNSQDLVIATKANTTYVDTNFLNKTTNSTQSVVSAVGFQGALTLDQQAILQSGMRLNASPSGNWTVTTEYIDAFTQNLVFTSSGGAVIRFSGDYGWLKSTGWSPSKVPIFNAQGFLVSSGVDSGKIDFLDNVSSDIQTQLNGKLNLSGGNANQDIIIGTYKVQSSATPSTGNDYTNKTYVDGQISGLGALYVLKAGDTMTGALVMGSNKITTSYTPVNAEDLTRKGYVDSQDALKLSLSGGTMTGDINGTALNNLRWGRSGDKRNNLAPDDVAGGTMAWYFGTYNNDGAVPFADHLIPNGWVDTTGGLTNCISYNKGGKGIRQYQGTYGSSTKFTTYYDCVLTDANSADVTLTGAITANSVNVAGQTASRVCVFDASKNVVSSTVTTTTLGFLDATSSIQTQLNTLSGTFANYLPLGGGILSGTLGLTSTNIIDFGYGVTKEANAGRIGYERFTSGCLDIVGGGTTAGDRRVVIYDKLGIGTNPVSATFQVSGSGLFSGDLTVNGTLKLPGLTGSRVLTIDASNNVGSSSVTTTELGYLSGTTSSVQSQLNEKAPTTYVNAADALRVAKTGDSMSGPLLMGSNTITTSYTPINPDDLCRKGYVDGQIATRVAKAGDLMTGSLRFSNNVVTEWGSGVVGKEPNAGKIGYGWVSATGLDIVGGGTTAGQRAVICYDRLGVGVAPTTAFQVSGVGSISGNVGIGTTNPLSLLHLNSVGTHQVRFQTSHVDNHYITAANDLFAFNANLSLTGIPNVGRGSCQIILQTPTAGGFIQFMTGSAINTVPSERMRVSGDGNLGIGSTTPRAKLDVAGDIITDWNGRRIGTQYLTTSSGYFLGMTTNVNIRELYLDSQSADPGGTGAVVIRTGATPTERVRVDAYGQMASGVAGNTLYNLKFANSLSHIDNNAGEVYLFTAYNGHLAIGRNTNRDSSTANLVLGVASTEESQIISVKSDNSAYMPMSFAASSYFFGTGSVGIGIPSSGTYVNPVARFTINSHFYGGQDGGFCINTTDVTANPNKYNLRLYPFVQGAGQVGYQFRVNNVDLISDCLTLGHNGNIGIGTTMPAAPLHVKASGGSNPATNGIYIYNTTNTAGQDAIITVRTAGTSGGNPYISFDVANEFGWAWGMDNADNSMKLSSSWNSLTSATKMTISTAGNVGIGTTNPVALLHIPTADNVSVVTSLLNFRNTSNYGIFANSSSIGSRGNTLDWLSYDFNLGSPITRNVMSLTPGGDVGIGTTNPTSKFHLKDGWMRVDNGDVSTCVYGPNTTWSGRLRVGAGTSDYDSTTAQIISTSGNLHLDPSKGKDFYLGYYNDQASNLGTNYIYGDVQLRNKLTVGSGTSRTLMSVSGGANTNMGNTGAWGVNSNGCLYTQDQPSGANSAGLFIGYNGANLAGYTTTLAPGVAWLPYFIHSSEVYVSNNGGLVAYTQAGGWVNVSDEREKEDIQDLKTESSLQRVLALKPKHYRRKYPEDNATPVPQKDKEKRHVGFIAQEVQESNPHCVSTWCNEEAKCEEDDGVRLGMCYNDYVVHLVGGMQEQQKQIELLTERNKILEQHARKQEQDLEDYKKLTEERFNTLASLLGLDQKK